MTGRRLELKWTNVMDSVAQQWSRARVEHLRRAAGGGSSAFHFFSIMNHQAKCGSSASSPASSASGSESTVRKSGLGST